LRPDWLGITTGVSGAGPTASSMQNERDSRVRCNPLVELSRFAAVGKGRGLHRLTPAICREVALT
jgi:hypothetical protein